MENNNITEADNEEDIELYEVNLLAEESDSNADEAIQK